MIILIVEDESAVAQLWRRYLQDYAKELRIVHTLTAALTAMAIEPCPDLVLLDLRLPDSRDPESTLAAIQQLKGLNPKAVVVVVTGAVEETLPQLAEKLGADGFAQKRPQADSQRRLLSVVSEAIARRVNRKEPVFERSLAVLEALSALTAPSTAGEINGNARA